MAKQGEAIAFRIINRNITITDALFIGILSAQDSAKGTGLYRFLLFWFFFPYNNPTER